MMTSLMTSAIWPHSGIFTL